VEVICPVDVNFVAEYMEECGFLSFLLIFGNILLPF